MFSVDTADLVLDDGVWPGPQNMERDLRLLDLAEAGQIAGRVYEWTGPWVSLGFSQTRQCTLLPGCPVPSVPRPTGGKAVLHGHDLTVGLAMPLPEEFRTVRKAYRLVVKVLVESLNQAGINAALGEETRWVAPAGKVVDCFAHVSPNDVVDPATGRKVCGCALKLGRSSVLVQASVPVRAPLIDPAEVFAEPAPQGSLTINVSRGDLTEMLRRSLAKVHFDA